jgi:beta-glucosidase
MDLNRSLFPKEFVWGVSTAAAQIEGAWNLDGKSPSIWDTFSRRKGKIHKNHHPEDACDFFRRWPDDVRLMKELGIPAFRFSLAWTRIIPDGKGSVSQKGLDFYKRLTDGLLEAGIDPWVTLYHWDLPQALEDQGGWTSREILYAFTEFAEVCGKELGHRGIKNWMVLNEPLVFTGAGYFLGYHAPGKKGLKNFLPAMLHAALAQSEGERALRSQLSSADKIGTTFSCSYLTPKTESERDRKATERVHALLNCLFFEAAIGKGFPADRLPYLKPVEKWMKAEDERNLAGNFDFIGVQNYTREVVESAWYVPYMGARLVNARKRGVPNTEMQWEVFPEALYQMLQHFNSYGTNIPLIVTENGAAFQDIPNALGEIDDQDRIRFLNDYVLQMHRALKEGIPIDGYFIWTLLDNFEWAEGYRPRFGLIHTDFQTQKRTPKASARWFSEFLQSASEQSVLEGEWEDSTSNKG